LREPISVSMKESIARELLAFKDPKLVAGLLGEWSNLTPRSRIQVLDFAQRDPQAMLVVLDQVEASPSFAAGLGPSFRKAAREDGDPKIRQRSVALFGEGSNADTAARLARFTGALSLPGDATKGKAIYQVRCASCHRAANEGFALGPDLLTVAAAGRESLLANIIDPNREVAPRYEAWTATLKDGEELAGILVGEDTTHVTLSAASGVNHRLARSDLQSLASSGRSQMPAGLEEGMSPEDMADLLRFIESLTQP
jgi:putative heme-binding domain-containing protein